MMNEDLRDFIETYIDKIDNEEWEYVFDRWYWDSVANSPTEDEILLAEFFEIMNSAGISDLKERTIQERKAVISKRMDDVISDRWGQHYSRVDSWLMYYSDIVTDLYSWLGFNMEELYEILNTYKDEGLTPNPKARAFEVEGL